MKKSGKLSLIVYILYTLFGLGMIIYSKISIDKLNASGGGLEGLGLAIVLVIGIVLGAAGLIAVVLKLIHIKSGWILFGILCILADLVFIGAFISAASPAGDISQLKLDDVLPVIPFIVASIASLISNVKSLKD